MKREVVLKGERHVNSVTHARGYCRGREGRRWSRQLYLQEKSEASLTDAPRCHAAALSDSHNSTDGCWLPPWAVRSCLGKAQKAEHSRTMRSLVPIYQNPVQSS